MSVLATPISLALVKELESRYPPKRPAVTDTIPEIFEYAGHVALIEYIRESYKAQQQTDLEKEVCSIVRPEET